jgi:ribosomal protein S1
MDRIQLLNQELADPKSWKKIRKAYSSILILEGTIINVIESGAYVNIDGVCGFLPKDEIHDHKVDDISQVLKSGQRVRVLVYELDNDKKTFYVSIRLTKHSMEKVSEMIKSKASVTTNPSFKAGGSDEEDF